MLVNLRYLPHVGGNELWLTKGSTRNVIKTIQKIIIIYDTPGFNLNNIINIGN